MKKNLLLAVVVLAMVIPGAAFGADKLIVQDGSSNTQFVVTDAGTLGLGTATPTYVLTVSKTGSNAAVAVQRTDGAGNYMNAGPNYANFGSFTNHPLRLTVNGVWQLQLNADHSFATASGAYLTAGGVWTSVSTRAAKENIAELSSTQAYTALKGLTPVTYNYKVDKKEHHVGFIAEDVPALVATKDRKGLSPMDIVAVLTKVVQEQNKTIDAMAAKLDKMEKEITKLKSRDYTAQK